MRSLQRDPLYLELVHFYMIIYVHLYLSIYKRHVYRLGGDEFIAVLPNITHPAFQKLLETAKSQLGDTASLGTTISGTKDTDFESLLKAADAEMYENKTQYYIVTGKERRKHSL